MGVTDEAQTAAAILGHNYPNSRWDPDAVALLKTGGLTTGSNTPTPGSRSSATPLLSSEQSGG